jgi:hypothetical protein
MLLGASLISLALLLLLALILGLLTPLKPWLLKRGGFLEVLTLAILGLLAAGIGVIVSDPAALKEHGLRVEWITGTAAGLAFVLLWFWLRACATRGRPARGH